MIDSQLLPAFVRMTPTAGSSAGGEAIAVRNPATGEVLAHVPEVGPAGAVSAADAAETALEPVPALEERTRWLQGIHAGLVASRDELARIITLEQGKPLREGAAEVDYAAGFFSFFAREIGRLEPEDLPETIRGARWTVHRRPAGVAALITPWNFPLAMLAKKLSAALAGGCTVVVKPAKFTPLSALALGTLAERAGVPSGRLGFVTGRPGPISDALCAHPAVRVISFTGSTEVGKLLMARAAPGVKRLALELGGNAPFIVFRDADLERAADALVLNKFRAGGQTCVCTNRVLVERSIHDEFVELVAERVRRLRVGNGLDPATDIGPLIHREAFDKVQAHVSDAIERGARRIVGEDPPRPTEEWGAFFPPTLLTGITGAMLVCREETFGPVVAVAAFDAEDDAVRTANGTRHGLAAYVFTRDEARASRVIARLRFGHVGLNTGTSPVPEAPFGGMKESGFGREGGVEGLFEYTETQVVARG